MTPTDHAETQDRAAPRTETVEQGHYDGRGFVHGKGCDRVAHYAESCPEHMHRPFPHEQPENVIDRAAPRTEAAEPRTEAGRYLLDHFGPAPAHDAQELHRRSAEGRRTKLRTAILTIEEQAARLAAPQIDVRLLAKAMRQCGYWYWNDPVDDHAAKVAAAYERLSHD